MIVFNPRIALIFEFCFLILLTNFEFFYMHTKVQVARTSSSTFDCILVSISAKIIVMWMMVTGITLYSALKKNIIQLCYSVLM